MNGSDVRTILTRVARRDYTALKAIRAIQAEEKKLQLLLKAQIQFDKACQTANAAIEDVADGYFTKPERKKPAAPTDRSNGKKIVRYDYDQKDYVEVVEDD
jgi:hypothetical protein